jgi:hypothetical protein
MRASRGPSSSMATREDMRSPKVLCVRAHPLRVPSSSTYHDDMSIMESPASSLSRLTDGAGSSSRFGWAPWSLCSSLVPE